MLFKHKIYKKAYRFYRNELSNFQTVLKDTNNNIISADQYDYNCMSYAFNIFDEWLVLDSFTSSYIWGEETDCVDYEYLAKVFFDCCQELIDRFNARRLMSVDDVIGEDERMIAFRIGEDERMIAFRIGGDDFHFVRKNSDGTWTHKPGSNYIREISEDELLSSSWSDYRQFPYVSEIAFFAVKM